MRNFIKNRVLSKSNKSVLVKNHLINSDKNFVIPHATRIHGSLGLLFTLKITCSWNKKKINYPEWGELRKCFIGVAGLFQLVAFLVCCWFMKWNVSCLWWGCHAAFLHSFVFLAAWESSLVKWPRDITHFSFAKAITHGDVHSWSLWGSELAPLQNPGPA